MTVEDNGDRRRDASETRGGRVNLIVDRKANQVVVDEGPVKLADAWAQIVQTLDNHPPQPNDDTRLVRLNAAKTNDVLKALSALPRGTATSVPGQPATGSGENGRFINMIFQPRQDGDQAGSAATNQSPTTQLAQANPSADASFARR